MLTGLFALRPREDPSSHSDRSMGGGATARLIIVTGNLHLECFLKISPPSPAH